MDRSVNTRVNTGAKVKLSRYQVVMPLMNAQLIVHQGRSYDPSDNAIDASLSHTKAVLEPIWEL